MTINDIINYFKKSSYMVFKYNSKYYSIIKRVSLFHSTYSLISLDVIPQKRNSLKNLFEEVFITENILLREAISNIEIPLLNDSAWETYEAIRHCAIIHGSEIHFMYNGKYYWIAHLKNGESHLSDDSGNTQIFDSCRALFENACIGNNSLKDIWDKVKVDAC